MSLLALMAAAAAGTVAIPAPKGNPDSWFGANDIPKGELREGNDGVFILKAVVASDGKVDLCQVRSTGARQEDRDDFCKRVKHRAKFDNVTDEHGAPAYYVLEDSYAYVLPDSWRRYGLPPEPNAVIDVEKLPGAPDGKTDVLVNVSIDVAGKLRRCNPAPKVKGPQRVFARLACGQLTSSWSPLPEHNAKGETVPYVRQMWVEFKAKS